MGESVDVKALRAKFNSTTSTLSTSQDSGPPKSPRPGFGRACLPAMESHQALPRLSPTVPPPLAPLGLPRFPRAEPMVTSIPPRDVFVPRPPPNPGVRASHLLNDSNKVKQKGEMLNGIMPRHQEPAGTRTPPAPQVPAAASTPTRLPPREQLRQRSTGEVTPLRKPLPPEGPLPMKPRRPPVVNLEPFLRSARKVPPLPGPRRSDVRPAGSPGSAGRRISLPGALVTPKLPQRSNKPGRLLHQMASVDIEDDKDYDDIASFEKTDSWSDNSSQCLDGNDDEVYELVDEDTLEMNRMDTMKKKKKEAKRQLEQEKREQTERQKKEKELRKKFQLQGEQEVLHTARVRNDWHGEGKLDLTVRQGESVEILRVRDNPGGKWLARSLDGQYGYISNACVDIDYEEVKRKLLHSRTNVKSALPPPPPDPPNMFSMETNNRDSLLQDDYEYDDVQPLTEDFPPPPPETSIDSKKEKEIRKKFKYEGPLTALHTMMVNPNSMVAKPGGKDLPVTPGEVLEVIQVTNSKKVFCRNPFGKYGYVSKNLLLPMEGDIYDDVDYPGDIYENNSL